MPTGWNYASVVSCARGRARHRRDLDAQVAEIPYTARFSPGERYGQVYQINYLRCIGCGLCIEAYPTLALTIIHPTSDDELPRRPDLARSVLAIRPLPPPFPQAFFYIENCETVLT